MKSRAALALSVFACAAIPASASTFVHMSSAELVSQADALIQGHVVELRSFWSESGRVIVTEADVAVEETILGEAPSLVTVRTFGGQVGDVRVEAHGFPVFEPDERVLLFITTNGQDGSIRVLGYQQGQYRVVTRRDGVTLAVPMVEDGVRFFAANGVAGPEPRSLEIGTFKARIRDIARRASATGVGR